MLSQPWTKQQVARMVEEEILQVLAEMDPHPDQVLPKVVGEQRLRADLGLTSLELAQLVAALETRAGADPFQELVPITTVGTVADLCRAYERCLCEAPRTEAARAGTTPELGDP